MTKEEILAEIDRIDNQLSPENLTCDGELPRSEVNRRYKQLMKRRKQLEQLMGLGETMPE